MVPLETEYLQQVAKNDELVLDILDDNQMRPVPPQPKYRRFRKDSPG
jgi:hypothetical protein